MVQIRPNPLTRLPPPFSVERFERRANDWGNYYGYTAEQLKIVAGTGIGLTIGPLLFSHVDGWGVERVAFAFAPGALAVVVRLTVYRL